MVLVNLQKDHLYSYLKGVTFTLSRNWEMNYKHVYVLGLITFGLQTFYKCTLKYFFLIENILPSWIAVIMAYEENMSTFAKQAGRQLRETEKLDRALEQELIFTEEILQL